MSKDKAIEKTLSELVSRLRPRKGLASVRVRTSIWIFCATAIILALMLSIAPFRPGFSHQLLVSPRFFVEVVVSAALVCFAAYCALALSIPGTPIIRVVILTSVLLVTWVGLNFYGTYFPSLPPNMLGKREFCFYETLVFSVPIALVLLYMLRRGYVAESFWAGTLTGIAAASTPAALMQLACMYEPHHNLSHHIFPIVVISLIFAVLGDINLSQVSSSSYSRSSRVP